MLLLGLFLSGVMHVFISRDAILRWFRKDGLKSVATSAAIGVPMPLCSCSVVPIVAEMRRKGASRSACMSFLITAPETGADSILVTNAFFGPVVAVARPVISFVTAVAAGLSCMRFTSDNDRVARSTQLKAAADCQDCAEDDHDHDHEVLFQERNDCYISLRQLVSIGNAWLISLLATMKASMGLHQRQAETVADQASFVPPSGLSGSQLDSTTQSFGAVVRHVFRYGFVEIADDILFALIVGITLGAVLYLSIPADLMTHEHAHWIAYPVMLLVGIPLYICASASTPIAAALVAKGVSPGAALVFLMTGPATNTGTIAIIVSQFGTRFAAVYVASVILVTVSLGVIIDLAFIATGWSIAVNLGASESPAILALQWGGALALGALIIWRFQAGALKSGFNDLMINLRPVGRRIASMWQRAG